MEQIRPNVYLETHFHGVTVAAVRTNSGLIGIDTPTLPADARRWRLQLSQLDAGVVQFVINTDHNRDRTLGNLWFDAPVIAHENTYIRSREYPDVYKPNFGEMGGEHEFAHDLAGLRNTLPQLTFSSSLELLNGNSPLRLWHRGGSTSGAIWLELPTERLLFIGDTVFGQHPFVGDCDIATWLHNLDSLESLTWAGYTFITGRRVGLVADAIAYSRYYLKYLRNLVQDAQRTPEGEVPFEQLTTVLLERFPPLEDVRHLMVRRLHTGLKRLLNLEMPNL